MTKATIFNPLYEKVVRQELGNGYRGYRLTGCGMFSLVHSTKIRHSIHMLMQESPLHPNDGMTVRESIEEIEISPETVVTIAINACLSIRDLIDKAYESPRDLKILTPEEVLGPHIWEE